MRFAISLLTVLAIASVIGTVLKQNEPYTNYVIEFGQFWFEVFSLLGLFDVYHAGWFLTILVFLVLSTSLCIYRNTPQMLREMKSFREHATESSLRHFAHQAQYHTALAAQPALERLTKYLDAQGYRSRRNETAGESPAILIAAKAGSYHRVGYILTHVAIVIICIGGLIDGNVPLKAEELFGLKKIETRNVPQSQVPAISRLSPANLSFRGNVTIPEGSSADVVFLPLADGYLVQDLPFTIALKKFHIEHYTTGQPKSFASDVVVTDKETGRSLEHTITVNHPLIYKGIAIYQASFEDGGSHLLLNGWNLFSSRPAPFPFSGVVKQDSPFTDGAARYTVEFSEFRPFNVQSMGHENMPQDKRPSGLLRNLANAVETSSSVVSKKNLRNVGPSFQFRLRDAQGQAREFDNYMLPMQFDQRWYLVSGVRGSEAEPFRYIRFPLDEQGSLESFMQLRATLFDAALYPEIARRFVASAMQGDAVSDTLRAKLADSTVQVLRMFAGGGYDALAKFITSAVPAAEQEKAAATYLKLLERSAVEAWQLARSRAGKPPAAMNNDTLQFVRDSMNTVNDSFFYGAPVYLQLTQYEQVQASGLQLTRSPGRNMVYAGSALLVLGVFAMFYIRERRIWLLLQPRFGELLFAMSGNRKSMDFDREFELHRQNLAELLKD